MQHFTRRPLSAKQYSYLKERTAVINLTGNVAYAWETSRRTKIMKSVHEILEKMSGARARCMYCLDSHGTDIDHFFPKSVFPDRAFIWTNMLLCCSGCNTAKLAQFPVGSDGGPLLIDPTADDPWTDLEYNSATDLFAARWKDGVESQKGAKTLESFRQKLQHESIVEGRRRIRRNLERAVHQFLNLHEDRGGAEGRLIETLIDNDSYGLLHWFFNHDGAGSPPFSELRDKYSEVWNRVRSALFASL